MERQLDDPSRATHYADLLDRYSEQGGYRLETAAERVLGSLGLETSAHASPLSSLSAGQRARVRLARCLVAGADLLLLDEPGNHLDVAALEWLENYLLELRAPFLMVSHDREMLCQVTNRTFELERGKLCGYAGNYDDARRERGLRLRRQWEEYESARRRDAAAQRAAQRRMAVARRLEKAPAGVRAGRDHYRRKAAKVARTARMLRERSTEQAAKKPWEETSIPMLSFSNVSRSGDVVVTAQGIAKSYGNRTLFHDLSLCIQRGQRWAVTGPNGCGKTTLLRILAGALAPDRGSVHLGANVHIGYYAQEGDNLDPGSTPLGVCREASSDVTLVRTMLGCLKLPAELIVRPIAFLSAGERAKAAVARLLVSGASLLLLDEPTNHLEIEALEALEAALIEYPGTVVFVSHDRRFLRRLATHTCPL
jgi:ATP-binding cassette subfamily F protein 3